MCIGLYQQGKNHSIFYKGILTFSQRNGFIKCSLLQHAKSTTDRHPHMNKKHQNHQNSFVLILQLICCLHVVTHITKCCRCCLLLVVVHHCCLLLVVVVVGCGGVFAGGFWYNVVVGSSLSCAVNN